VSFLEGWAKGWATCWDFALTHLSNRVVGLDKELEGRPTAEDSDVERAVEDAIAVDVPLRCGSTQVPPQFVIFINQDSADVVTCRISRVQSLVSENLHHFFVKVDFAV